MRLGQCLLEVGEILLCDYPPDIREFRLFVLIRQKLTSASTPKLAPKRAERRLSRFHCSGLIFDSFFLLFFGPFLGKPEKEHKGSFLDQVLIKFVELRDGKIHRTTRLRELST